MVSPPMTPLARTLIDIAAALSGRFAFSLVGGLAVSVHTQPRFTRDLDIAIATKDNQDANQALSVLECAGYHVDTVVEHVRSRRLTTARLFREAGAARVDVLFAACGLESEIASEATIVAAYGQAIPVATVGHLIAMKLVSANNDCRPLDRVDIVYLSQVADDTEWARAEAAVRLIQERGFSRGRDLAAALAEWRERARVIRSEA